MKQKVYIDSDIILDVLIAREPHAIISAQVISLCEQKKIQGFTSSIAILNIAYVLGRSKMEIIKPSIEMIKSLIQILPTTQKDIEYSLGSRFSDFEDGVQSSIALSKNLEYIITRNTKDYKFSEIQAITPEMYLQTIK